MQAGCWMCVSTQDGGIIQINPLIFMATFCLEFSLIWGLAIVMVVKVFQKYVEAHALHTPATWEWIVIAVLYAVYLTVFIVTVAVIQGLNKKLTRLDKVRSDLRIVSDKLSDTLATTTIGTAQKVGEGKVQATLAAAELRDATAAQREKSIEMLRIKRAELRLSLRNCPALLPIIPLSAGALSSRHFRRCSTETIPN